MSREEAGARDVTSVRLSSQLRDGVDRLWWSVQAVVHRGVTWSDDPAHTLQLLVSVSGEVDQLLGVRRHHRAGGCHTERECLRRRRHNQQTAAHLQLSHSSPAAERLAAAADYGRCSLLHVEIQRYVEQIRSISTKITQNEEEDLLESYRPWIQNSSTLCCSIHNRNHKCLEYAD